MRVLMWQEQHPTVHGGAESWAIDTSTALDCAGTMSPGCNRIR